MALSTSLGSRLDRGDASASTFPDLRGVQPALWPTAAWLVVAVVQSPSQGHQFLAVDSVRHEVLQKSVLDWLRSVCCVDG